MAPTLLPGDWLLVDPRAYRDQPPTQGELVLVPDPRARTRLLVKRVASVAASGAMDVRGDAPGASTDSRTFGAVLASAVEGRPWFRYWPPSRLGRID